MGAALFELVNLQDNATHENLVASVNLDGKPRGELRLDVYVPALIAVVKVMLMPSN